MQNWEIMNFIDDEHTRTTPTGEVVVTFDHFNDEGYAVGFVTYTPDYVDGESNGWGESYCNSICFVENTGGVEDNNGELVELDEATHNWIERLDRVLPAEPCEAEYWAARAEEDAA